MLNDYDTLIAELSERPVFPDRAPSLKIVKDALKELQYEYSDFFKKQQQGETQVVLVAGTNGKGSVVCALAHFLVGAGKRVGWYTSPHLVNTTERIRINSNEISREDFVKTFDRIKKISSEPQLTHFEALTLMAVDYFTSGAVTEAVDTMILEVGLGGLWDATNAIPHSKNVIAKIGMDHEHILGHSLSEILENKLGIVHKKNAFSKQGRFSQADEVIHFPFPMETRKVVSSFMEKTGAQFYCTQSLEYKKGEGICEYGSFRSGLLGRRGAENTYLALKCFERLGEDPKKAMVTASGIRWPGRMEKIARTSVGTPIYLSGDHNEQGIKSAIEILGEMTFSKLWVVAGVGLQKDSSAILGPLMKIANNRVFLTKASFRAKSKPDLTDWVERSLGFFEDPIDALVEAGIQASPDDLILVSGSLYLVGDVRKALIERLNENFNLDYSSCQEGEPSGR